uniref:Uncharacterized protein n=1 Tax=Meloidogyne incognita TaxID=6306 RepID=A0A914KZV6_MELIC
MNSEVRKEDARYEKGQSSSDTPLNSKEGASSASQGQSSSDIPLNSKEGASSASQGLQTHPRIIGQHPQPAYQHQTLGPPAGFEAPQLALRPGINVQTRSQILEKMHDVQIIENTNSNVETNEKIKMNSGVKIKHARYRKGQPSSDTPLNSKEGASSASQVVPPTATHPRIIGQYPQPAFQHQTLGPPPGAVIERPVTGHDGKDQDLQQHDNQIVEYTNSKVEKSARKKRKKDSEKDALILQCFNDGLSSYQAEKEIIKTKDTNFTSLSTIKRRFKELDALILQCFNDGLTSYQAENKIIETKGINIKLSAILRRFKELGYFPKDPSI